MKITEKEATDLLKNHLKGDLSFLNKSLTVKVNVCQYVALLSFIYNLGRAAFQRSTLRMKLNRGEYQEAANEFLKWNKARVNGVLKPINGLTKRRSEERELFLKSK